MTGFFELVGQDAAAGLEEVLERLRDGGQRFLALFGQRFQVAGDHRPAVAAVGRFAGAVQFAALSGAAKGLFAGVVVRGHFGMQ